MYDNAHTAVKGRSWQCKSEAPVYACTYMETHMHSIYKIAAVRDLEFIFLIK